MSNNATINKMKFDKMDWIIMFMLAVLVWLVAASSLGFLSAGFNNPFGYGGNDDFSITAQTKELLQENWVWNTYRLGAPYGHEALAYPSVCLQIPEFLMMKFWGLFTNDVTTVINLQFVFTFALCAVIAYVVLRKMSIGRLLSFVGGALYAINPYIYGRNIVHYCLSACYFIPLAIYLCYCCYFDSGFLKFDKTLICKRSIYVLLMCICISTNGIGYYPFFACFYLCVTALIAFFRNNNIKEMLSALKTIALICSFMMLALLPAFFYRMASGIESITSRNPSEMEIYSLKITQLFIPMFSHGISWVQNFINEYNGNMPLVNENVTAYLGVIGCVGFTISVLYIFGFRKNVEIDEDVLFLSRLNLAAVLFMSIGGFISILCVAIHMYELRGFNRISIFISFCSITVLCILAQRYFLDTEHDDSIKKIRWQCIPIIVVLLFGIWEQTPQLYSDGAGLIVNKRQWDIDEAFINKIESYLQDGDMVYQLPYHKYPEAGIVYAMNDYQLLVGYLHSDSLKWSYGGFKGGEGDQWNEYVSLLDMWTRIDTIISSGFRGIYIESRAYTEDELSELLDSIEEKLGYDPLISADGKLYFYNLYPYIESHSELLNKPALTIQDIEYPSYVDGEDIIFTLDGYNASRYVTKGISEAEEAYSWTDGDLFEMQFTYENAPKADFIGEIEVARTFNGEKEVSVYVNGKECCKEIVNGDCIIEFEGQSDEDGIVEISIDLPDSISPLELGESEDYRDLALAIRKIRFSLQ